MANLPLQPDSKESNAISRTAIQEPDLLKFFERVYQKEVENMVDGPIENLECAKGRCQSLSGVIKLLKNALEQNT